MQVMGLRILSAFLIIVGALLAAGGAWLAALGGSLYYLVAGLGCLVSGVQLWRRKAAGVVTYAVVLAGTVAWAFWEVGSDFWQLLPRVGGPLFVGIVLLLPWISHPLKGNKPAPAIKRTVTPATAMGAVVAVALVGGGWAAFSQRQVSAQSSAVSAEASATADAAGTSDDWTRYGRTDSGTRFSPATQITPANVNGLEVAWTYRTGDTKANYPNSKSAFMFQAVPLKVGDLLYFCTPHDIVVALDANTGAERWRHDPKTDDTGVPMLVCRGVSYFKASEPVADCPERVLVGTIDGRMIALDAKTGQRCQSFGRNGEISLREGLGKVEPGFHYSTSPATIIGNAAVIGGFVLDGVSTGEPSGVVRAFDARNGKLLWAWDLGKVDTATATGQPELYTPGTPNAWTVFSADPQLGLVYVPTGNSTPDYYGGTRSALSNKYSSSIVALDVTTGKARWSFQTVHNDLWDYDIGSQPVLIDMPVAGGAKVPALIQPTKHGEIYLLDRRTGKPLAEVQERPAPQGNIPGEKYSPTQPWSVGTHSFTPPPLTETDMWGATPLDQLWCRIQFHRMDYRGKFTPPATHQTLQFPGNFGVIDWGSVAVDESRGLMLVNTSYMPMTVRLIPRAEYEKNPTAGPGKHHGGVMPQSGTPYAVEFAPFMSPLGLPCNAPPWGHISAVDLKTQKLVWQTPLGTTQDHAPLGIPVPGVFNLGGAVTTKGGVTFIAATIDNYLRAFDAENGRELWKGRLPAGGQSNPISYTGSNGRQYVVIAAGGHGFMDTTHGDYVIAYALPNTTKQ